MMTLKRFRALARSYGAELQRWPQEERGAARELLDSSEEARALLEQESSLDEAIAAAAAHRGAVHGPRGAQDVEHRPDSKRDATLARLRSAVAARIATEAKQAKPAGWLGWLFGSAGRVAPVRMRRLGLATSAAFAIIAGLLVGGLYGPAPAPVGALSALLQPATLELLAD